MQQVVEDTGTMGRPTPMFVLDHFPHALHAFIISCCSYAAPSSSAGPSRLDPLLTVRGYTFGSEAAKRKVYFSTGTLRVTFRGTLMVSFRGTLRVECVRYACEDG